MDGFQPESASEDASRESGRGYGKFLVELAELLTIRIVLDLATYFSFPRARYEELQQAKYPGKLMTNNLQERGFISASGISPLIKALEDLKLDGVKNSVLSLYKLHTSDNDVGKSKKSFLAGQLEKLKFYLRLAYERLYRAIQPIPYIRDRLFCVNEVFVEGGIEFYNVSDKAGYSVELTLNPNQTRKKSLKSYTELFDDDIVSSNRVIVEGEPGYGKSMLTLQAAYDWCERKSSSLKGAELLILLPLRLLKGITSFYEAIKLFILPSDCTLTTSDIQGIISSCSSVVIILDGYDEYPDMNNDLKSHIKEIIKGKMFSHFKVILSTRSGCLPQNLDPRAIRVRMTGFDEDARDRYVCMAVVGGSSERTKDIRQNLEKNPIMCDLCQVPLFFVMVAHMAHESTDIYKCNSVTSFFKYMIHCFYSHMWKKDEEMGAVPRSDTANKRRLCKLAFDGLTGGEQNIVWEKTELCRKVGTECFEELIRTGILVEEKILEMSVTTELSVSEYIQEKIIVRFYHKLFAEWYAAHYVAERASSSLAFFLSRTLRRVNPIDLQFVFRFACGLRPSCTVRIVNYLRKIDGGESFAPLCILEYTGGTDDILDTVRDMCSSTVEFSSQDSQLLHRSRMQLLYIAAYNQIPISSVSLRFCFESVDLKEECLCLSSGLQLPRLDTLKELEIFGNDDLRDSARDILNYSARCLALKTFKFTYGGLLSKTLLPQSFDDEDVLACLHRKNCKVEWEYEIFITGEGFQYRNWKLNLLSGKWEDEKGEEMADGDYESVVNNSQDIAAQVNNSQDIAAQQNTQDFDKLREDIAFLLQREECLRLAKFLGLSERYIESKKTRISPAKSLLFVLEEEGILKPWDVSLLLKPFIELDINSSCANKLLEYQKNIPIITAYERFVTDLSSHISASTAKDLCKYFDISIEKTVDIMCSLNPGLSLMFELDKMAVIQATDTKALDHPLRKFSLMQALAKLLEYQSIDSENDKNLLLQSGLSIEDKKFLFIGCLKKKINNWYEAMTPLPWKKSCKWKATDLFVGSGLILKDSLSTKHPKNIDNKCKLQYNQILDHENLFSEKRLVLEGDPGCGKTMLTAQLAYDWSKDKLQNVDILIWLPLNFVKEKTLVEAIKDFYIPESIPLSKDEIEKVLSNESMVITVLLDGLEEYSCNVKDDDASELMKVFSGGKHSNWKVVLTCRSDYARNLPACPRLQVGLFGDEERTEYIKRLCKGDTEMQNELEIIIKNNPLIHDLCSVPLLFVLAVHNIEATKTMKEGQCKRVGPFMKSMISTMIAKETPEGNVVGQSSEYPSIELLHLGEVAFNGLCMGHQKLMWERQFLESNVENCRDWINSGVLTIEEVHFSTKLNEEAELERNKVQTYDEVATVEEDDSRVSEKTELKENFTYLEQNTKENAESRVMHTEKTSIFETSHAVVGENYPITEENSSSLETKPKNMHTGKGYLSRKYVPQGVKFLHKVIQEWFAASYFSHMMKKCHNKLHYSKFIFESLLRIDPVDLHYVLRFSCFLHPPFCHSVMTHLLQQYRADGIVPDYIMDVVFLCFAEQNDSQRTDIEHVVSKLCKNDIVIGYRDGRLLQQAKAKLLEFASSRKIVIERVVLPVLLSDVTENGITLSSGERIGILDTLRKVEVDSWEPQPNEEHLKDMVEFFSRSQQIMEICCVIPSPPPSNITDVTKSRLYAKKITVKWKIGEVIHTFNARKGTWMCKTRIQPSEYRMEGGKNSDPLQASAAVCQDGCLLTVPGTGVALNIPPNAFSDGKKHHVTLRILPHQIFDECSFVDQSTVMVEILPNKLTLQEDAKLILPHCLEIHNPEECPVQVLQSHHDPGTEPKWEDISKSVTFTLREHFCEIFINTFCWITYKLADGTKVKGKRIVVYATGDVPTFQGHRRNCAKIDVGYYPDLASEGKMFRLNRGDITVRQTLMFLREPTTGLQITLTEINPDWWTSKATKKMIEYAEIANSNEMRQSFILNTEESDASPLSCFFEVAKGGRSAELCIILKPLNATTNARTDLGYADKRIVTATHCHVLSEGLTSGDWKIVGRFLGLDEGDLDHISSDNPNNLREMKYKMLMKWKQKEGHEATYELLEKALRKAERVDLANKVSTLQG